MSIVMTQFIKREPLLYMNHIDLAVSNVRVLSPSSFIKVEPSILEMVQWNQVVSLDRGKSQLIMTQVVLNETILVSLSF